MKSTEILYVGNQLLARGGSPTSIDILAPLLRKEGYKVKAASPKKNKLLRLVDMLVLILKNASSADYVLIDTYSTTNFWYAYSVARLCRRLGVKYIPILHGGNLPERLKKSPKACYSIFSGAFVNISPSLYLESTFRKAGYSNIKYIPNSIDLREYRFKDRKDFKPKLLWVRAFSEIYNPLLAVQTLELLLKKSSEAELCMVGPEKDDSLEICREYSIRKNLPVTFTGKLEKGDWIKLSSDYDIFLNTTKVDNSPVSVIEAMALGLPVVSTNVGGIPYLISDKEDGWLVTPNNPKEMAQAVLELIETPQQTGEIALAARRKAELFNWNEVKEKWNGLLHIQKG